LAGSFARTPAVRIANLDVLAYAGNPANLRNPPHPGRYTVVCGDVCDRDLVVDLMHTHEVDAIVHFAAESYVDRSVLGPAPFVRTSVEGNGTCD
jgi:dTDP-glucose 4,6-dehydratase